MMFYSKPKEDFKLPKGYHLSKFLHKEKVCFPEEIHYTTNIAKHQPDVAPSNFKIVIRKI